MILIKRGTPEKVEFFKGKNMAKEITNKTNNNNKKRKWIAATAAKSVQSCPTLCNPIDGSPWIEVSVNIRKGIFKIK